MDNWKIILSELFVNLCAGWLGAIIITPNYTKKVGFKKRLVLIVDLGFAIVCLLTAYYLR